MIVVAVIWLFRGLNLISAGLWYGYVWIKRGLPASDLNAINELTFPQWVRVGLFFVGLFMLYAQLYAQRANSPIMPDTAQ